MTIDSFLRTPKTEPSRFLKGNGIIGKVACTLSAVLLSLSLSAQAPERQQSGLYKNDSLAMRIVFRKGSSEIEPSFAGNAGRIDSMKVAIGGLLGRPGAFLEQIFITTTASPEGSTDFNIRLSRERGDAVKEFLVRDAGLNPFNVHINSNGEDWDGLKRAVESLSEEAFPWREDVLSLIGSPADWDIRRGSVSDRRKARLMALDGGRPWEWLLENVFPSLRSGTGDVVLVVSYPLDLPEAEEYRDTVWMSRVDTVETVVVRKPRKEITRPEGPMLLAVRTNAAFVPLANVGVEVPLGDRWSLGVDVYYPWIWRDAVHEDCFELNAFGLDVRRWFPGRGRPAPNDRLTGHSVGVYGVFGYYDFERAYAGHQGEYVNVGVDYMYGLSVLKGRLHFEFGLGVGYIYSPARPYDVFADGGDAFRRLGVMDYIRWFGPTRAHLSVVVPIYGKRKGGAE